MNQLHSNCIIYIIFFAIRAKSLWLEKVLKKIIKQLFGGEKGIRTLDTFNSIHAFQAGAFNHSAISPLLNLPIFIQ